MVLDYLFSGMYRIHQCREIRLQRRAAVHTPSPLRHNKETLHSEREEEDGGDKNLHRDNVVLYRLFVCDRHHDTTRYLVGHTTADTTLYGVLPDVDAGTPVH